MSRMARKVRSLATMPEQQPHAETPPGGWHLQMSKLLSVLFVVAIAATGGLIVTLILGLSAGPPPGSPPPGSGGGNGGPPPFDFRTIEVFTIMTGVGPHVAQLVCDGCGRGGRWLSRHHFGATS